MRTLSEEDYKIWNMFKTQFKYEYERVVKKVNFKELLDSKKEEIDTFIGKQWYTEGYGGWKCDESPVKVCVYSEDCVEEYGDECCSYCGQPEERK